MTIGEWIEHVEELKGKYTEGCITAEEYFNAVVFYALGVERVKECYKLPSGIDDVLETLTHDREFKMKEEK